MRKLRIIAAIAVAAVALATIPCVSNAHAADVKVGYLSCHVSSGWGIIFGSSRELDCTYTPASGKEVEHYKGDINKYGADIGYMQSAVILWTVLAPSTNIDQGALAGHYAGATASATLGLGAGAHVMTGGMHSSIALQPISIEGNTGLNVAAGIATMNLEYQLPKHPHEK